MQPITASRPRTHHYFFAHQLLRDMLWGQDPERLMMILCGPRGHEFLRDVWNDVPQMLGDKSIALEPQGLALHTWNGHGTWLAVVQMPEPLAVSEAFMVGLMLRPPDGTLVAEAAGQGARPGLERAFHTLELGVTMDLVTTCTVLGRWTPQSHQNFGIGPPANPRGFAQMVCPGLLGPLS